MLYTNFGFFTRKSALQQGAMHFENEDGQDFYALLAVVMQHQGPYEFQSVYGAWVTLNTDQSVRNVYADPSALVPDGAHLLGLDMEPDGIETGMVWDEATTSFLPAPVVIAVPHEISDRQFFQTLANRGLISKQEALAAVKVGELPPAMLALIGQILDEDAAFAVEMAISGATIFERDHPDTELLAYLYGWDDAALDDIWIEAGNLK